MPSPHSRRTHLHVSAHARPRYYIRIKYSTLTSILGLQTPRLKRLAEIVSAQAIAQQEKFDHGDGSIEEVDEVEPEE